MGLNARCGQPDDYNSSSIIGRMVKMDHPKDNKHFDVKERKFKGFKNQEGSSGYTGLFIT